MGAQRTIVDQWSMTPVTNDVALRLLRVAYRRALGSRDDLYTDQLANDFAQEVKQQTYQLDDLRTLINNAAIKHRLGEVSDFNEKHDKIKRVELYEHVMTTQTDNTNNHAIQMPGVDQRRTVELKRSVPGYNSEEAQTAKDSFAQVVSANSLNIIYPGERINESNLAVIELSGFFDASGKPASAFRPATPLVIELRRQVYETNKDLEEIQDTGWLGRSQNKHDIPHDACYVSFAKDHGKGWYVWVSPSGLKEFEDFTLKILNLAGSVKEPTVSGQSGVKFTPSGNNSGGRL